MASSNARPASFLNVVSCGSSPEAWPIEIGWGFSAGPVRSMLLEPAPAWTLMAWDKGAEACHRIELEELVTSGKKALDACLVLNAALGQSDVHVGSVETESLWLFKLYRAGQVEPNFRLRPLGGPLNDIGRAEQGVLALRERFGAAQTV